MDGKQYLQDILEPTIREYANDRTSVRRGFLACVAAYHILDHLVGRKGVPILRKSVRRECQSFLIVERVAHAFKHVSTGNPNGEVQPLEVAEVISRPPAFLGQMRVGLSRLGDRHGGVTLAAARNVDLLAELGMVQMYFQQRIAPEEYPLPTPEISGG
jgi:hypothetical protein